MDLTWLTLALEIVGTVAFALSGVMESVKKELDILGVVVVGGVTAVGGGLMRDILLGILPPNAFTRPVYALIAIATSVLAFAVLHRGGEKSARWLVRANPVINVFDAIGLGVFAVVGVDTALKQGYADNPFLTLFVGTVTGVGGGLMRDILLGAIPMVLKKRVYAVAALVGAGLYLMLLRLGCNAGIAMPAGVAAVVLIRMLATYFKWNLPRIRLASPEPGQACPTKAPGAEKDKA